VKNYYELLGVPYTANRSQIKSAYLALLKQYHPDIFRGNKNVAQDMTAKLNVAYQVLSSSEQRLQYDRTIFAMDYTWNYVYDEQGNRVPIVDQTMSEHDFDNLPVFSFFNKSKFSEFFSFWNSLTPEQKKARKQAKKQERAQHRAWQKQQKQQNKINEKISKKTKQNKKEKINNKKNKKQKNKKTINPTLEQYYKNKKKLDTIIIILIILLVLIIGFIALINLKHNLA
jgi:curved DNA-binding protein CbpA